MVESLKKGFAENHPVRKRGFPVSHSAVDVVNQMMIFSMNFSAVIVGSANLAYFSCLVGATRMELFSTHALRLCLIRRSLVDKFYIYCYQDQLVNTFGR